MFYKIINKIKIHIKLNNNVFKTNLIKSDFDILNIFIKLNIVKSVKQDKFDKKFIIVLNNESAFKTFLNIYKPSKPVKIKLDTIIKLNRKSNRLFYLTTNKGLINNIEAENLKIGGILILNILQ